MFVIDKQTNDLAWNSFVQKQSYTLFVQSPHYKDFYEAQGEQGWIWSVKNNGVIVAGSVIVSVHARRGNFLYLPYGPIISSEVSDESRTEILELFFAELKKFARESDYHFIRVSPFLENQPAWQGIFKEIGFRSAPMHVLAELTWLLDLRPSEDELLSGMEKNHRNLVRRCEREGVRIDISTDTEAVADFNRLHDVTASRHKFHRFSPQYITKEFQTFSAESEALVLRAYLPDGTLDAAGIFMYYGTMSAYRHGASLMSDKKIPTSYLLQWEAIKEAKRRGCLWHNFWGIAPDNAPASHPFKGITHFKKGFGGQSLELVHCQDLPVSPLYWINWLVETFRSFNRGFK